LLNPIHQAAHQKEPAAIFPNEAPFCAWIDQAGVEIKTGAFVFDLEHERFVIDGGAKADAFRQVFVVPAQDCIRQRFGERHRDIQPAHLRGEGVFYTAANDNTNDGFDETDIAGDAHVDGKVKIPEPALGRLGWTRINHESLKEKRPLPPGVTPDQAREPSFTATSNPGEPSSGDLEQRIELRQLEQRLEVVIEIREPQVPVQLTNPLRERYQNPEAGAIDVPGPAKVDQELPFSAFDFVEDTLLELLPISDNQLPLNRDHASVAVFPD
jgi:hypothetical protein